jgi:hypothetical protein
MTNLPQNTNLHPHHSESHQMAVVVFDNSDSLGDTSYIRWLHDHPLGLVVNTRRRFDPTYTCSSIRQAARQADENPFVGRSYIKVCSGDEDELLAWIQHNGGNGFSKRCSQCGP